MADTSILVDSDELDVPSDPQTAPNKADDKSDGESTVGAAQFSEPSDNKLEKFVEIPQGEISKFTKLRSVKIDIERTESTAGVSTWWYMLSVLGTTCCVLPYTMIKTHLKDVKARRMRNMKMPKSRCATVVVLLMCAVSIAIFALLCIAMMNYSWVGSYWMNEQEKWNDGWNYDYNSYMDQKSPEGIVEFLKSKIQKAKLQNSALIAQSKNETMETNAELRKMIKLFTTTSRYTATYEYEDDY